MTSDQASTRARQFDPTRPLPPGITVLEASAGTGKTHTVASVAVSEVARGLPLEQLLLVTFTRNATGELRDRVWHRLLSAESELRAHLDGDVAPVDAVVATLADAPRPTVVDRHRRLRDAVANFDAATIATIHSFCQQILSGVGFAGDVDRHPVFLDDPTPLLAEVVDDLLLRKRIVRPDTRFGRDEAIEIASLIVTNPDARVLPAVETTDGSTSAGMRARFAATFRREFDRRKRASRVLTYDDLLGRLKITLDNPDVGGIVSDRLQHDYRLIAVDEFQDTDSVQWDILTAAFGNVIIEQEDDPVRLVLIGDPKQAIYAFRGADVHAYLRADEAAEATGTKRTLDVNWRSDQALLTALDTLFADAPLGSDRIHYRSTLAAPHHVEPRLVGGAGVSNTAMRIRFVERSHPGIPIYGRNMSLPAARAAIATDLAVDVIARLESGSELIERSPDGSEETGPVEPGDIAVLVRTNFEAIDIRDALERAGIPAVINGAGSVLLSRAASEWLTVLDAIERPSSTPRARAAALTSFFGWSTSEVDAASDDAWDEVHASLSRWGRRLADHGVTDLHDAIAVDTDSPARLLRTVHGERHLTDLRHVTEVLHEQAQTTGSTTALSTWLRHEIREAARRDDADSRSRRLETDAAAVQVVTVHRSKGLEYPIVYLPFLWTRREPSDRPPVFHDPDAGNERSIDVGGNAPDRVDRDQWKHRLELYRREDDEEDLRLAYVALTRPRHQVVLYWASGKPTPRSPLGRLVIGRDGNGGFTTPGARTPDDDDIAAALGALSARSSGTIDIEPVTARDPGRWTTVPDDDPLLDRRRFGRTIDRVWARTSYSSLTAAAYDQHRATVLEHDDRGIEDEQLGDNQPGTVTAADSGADPDEDRLRSVESRFGDLAGGARFGTLVHAVLETVDFTAHDLRAAVRDVLVDHHLRRHVDLDVDLLVDAIAAAIETPLGPIAGSNRLADIPRTDRLDELSFELPLAGGDRPTTGATLRDIADLFEHTVPPADPLSGYHELLADPVLEARLRGFLTGSIDLVLRTRRAGADRFVVIDHKSNWLGVQGEPLSAWHYRPKAMAQAMMHAHYPLQAMLYSVALHRYLRWRIPDYAPGTHLGGVAYLFLRGMVGADTPTVAGQPCGVFTWSPPSELVAGLSDLLDTGTAKP